MSVFSLIQQFIACETGASAIEYTLLAGGIALAILVALMAFGVDLAVLYDALTGAVQENN